MKSGCRRPRGGIAEPRIGTMAAAGAQAAAPPAFARPRTDETFGRFGLSRRRAVPSLRAPRAVAGDILRPPRGDSSTHDVEDACLEELLAKVRAALRVSGPADAHDSAMIWGRGENLGMPVRWSLRHDGARFLEEAVGPELSYVSGCDARDAGDEVHATHAHTAWETDFTGYTQALALDDREAALLGGWTRCHFWAKEEARAHLRLELLSAGASGTEDDDDDDHETFYVAVRLRDGLLRAVIAIDGATYLPKRVTARVCGDEETWTFAEWAPLRDFAAGGADASPRREARDPGGAMYPGLTVLEGSAGGKQTFRVTGARHNSGVGEAFYRPPSRARSRNDDETDPASDPTRVSRPSDARRREPAENAGGVSFSEGISPEVVIERARSSHVLVRPVIDGVDVGPFILDTGASGLVITKAAAERLPGSRPPFGEVFVSGVSGKVPCRFRRAGSLALGPIVVDRPVFMEMALGGIVRGASEPIAGIVGFDAFKSAVVEVGPGGAPVRIHDPRTFKADARWTWHALALVSNVPHVFATFPLAADRNGGEDEADAASANAEKARRAPTDARVGALGSGFAFMIDSGAGGADAIFHQRAVESLDLRRMLPPPPGGGARGASCVRGVGGSDGESSGATRAHRGELDWLELDAFDGALPVTGTRGSGGRFEKLDVLLAADSGFDLSEHSVGLICANALNTRRVVYDVPNRRVALLLDGVDAAPCESLLCAGDLDWVGEDETDAS